MNTAASKEATGFRVVRLFHPTLQTPNLSTTEQWLARAFGRDSTSLSTILPSKPEYPTEYSSFTVIRDVLLDNINPALHFTNGKQRYPSVDAPSLKGLGWYVDGMSDFYRALRAHGIRCMDLADVIAEGDEAPQSPGGGVMTFFAVPEDAGMQYQFFREGPFPLDPRATPGWSLGPVEADDPLRIQHCSHHTILTSNLARALRFAVDGLGGLVLRQEHNALLGTDSTFVAAGGTVLEYAVPAAGTRAEAALQQQAPNDAYHAITWKVDDLDRVERHLATLGVRISERSADGFITDAASSHGVTWGFTTREVAP